MDKKLIVGTIFAIVLGLFLFLNSEEKISSSDLVSGGPPKDGIPSIDNPLFLSSDEVKVDDDELVIVVSTTVTKIYPFNILVLHEIVNDFIGDDPILITYCPLCGSAVVYNRTLEGQAVEFGTTGKLYESNLVMYDRLSDTYWTQLNGEAIIGKFEGQALQKFPSEIITFEDAKEKYPDAMVLSRNTGFQRNYDRDPYEGYYDDPLTMFPVSTEDDVLGTKTVVLGIEINGKYKAYPVSNLSEGMTDSFAGNKIEYREGSFFVDKEEIIPVRTFWFAWVAFHPDTEVFK